MIKVPSGPTPAHGDLPCKSGWFKFLLDEDIASKLKRVPYQKQKNWAGKPVSQNMSQRESNQGCPAKKMSQETEQIFPKSAPRRRRGGACTSWKPTSCPSSTGLVWSRWFQNFKIVNIKNTRWKKIILREKLLHFRVGGRARASSGRRSTSEWNKDWLIWPNNKLHWEDASKASIPH